MKKYKFKGRVRVYETPDRQEKDEIGTERRATECQPFDKAFAEEQTTVTLFYNNAAEAAVALFAKHIRKLLKDVGDAHTKAEFRGSLDTFLAQAEKGYVDVSPSPLKAAVVEDPVVKFPVGA